VHRQQNSSRPRHVRIGDIEPSSAFERRSSPTRAAHACSQDALRSAQPTRGPMMSGTISAGTSLLRCRDPVAVRARASPTPAHRPTYPHSPRGLLASRGSPLNGRACWEAAPDVSEDAEPIYYLPEPRPQAAAPPSSRCASHSLRASMGSQRLHGWASTEGERRAAAAADAAAVAAARRVRRLRSTARPHAAGGRVRRPCGDARRPCARAWGRRSIWSFV
jgi:hypothetical protein